MPDSELRIDWSNAADPRVMQAKQLASGPAGEMMTKLPLYYSKAIIFGEKPKKDVTTKINSATVTLLELEGKVFAVTCSHVLEGYRQTLLQNEDAFFQIGDTRIDLKSQLVDESKKYDLATLLINEAQLKKMLNTEEIGSRVIRPSVWPPTKILVEDKILFGGFPGKLRDRVAFDEVLFNSFSTAGISVASVDEEKFGCLFEREHWIESGGGKQAIYPTELGGMSGGPAFVDRGQHFEFVGIIYQHSESLDIMFFRHAGLIGDDGKIMD
jgi:hypothetical protein